MGTADASARAAGTFEGLRAGRSSGCTKPEYPAASGRHDNATFGSGQTRQSDERDSEPDYLLRPTRHGQGGMFDNSVTPYATSGALASSRDALRTDSDIRAYRPCHRRDGTAGTPELIHRRYHRRAASLSVMTTGRA